MRLRYFSRDNLFHSLHRQRRNLPPHPPLILLHPLPSHSLYTTNNLPPSIPRKSINSRIRARVITHFQNSPFFLLPQHRLDDLPCRPLALTLWSKIRNRADNDLWSFQ